MRRTVLLSSYVDNPMLPQCAAEALADALKPADWMGTEEVTGNLGECP